MKTFETDVTVSADGTAVIQLRMPADVPVGTHRAVLVVEPSLVRPEPVSARRLFNPEGVWAGQGTDISDEELVAARAEMWGKLDREDAV